VLEKQSNQKTHQIIEGCSTNQIELKGNHSQRDFSHRKLFEKEKSFKRASQDIIG